MVGLDVSQRARKDKRIVWQSLTRDHVAGRD